MDTSNDNLLTPTEVARMLRVTVPTLAGWRARGKGPRYLKLHATKQGRVLYRLSEVRAFVERGAVERAPEGK